MRRSRFLCRNLLYFWRTNLAVIGGVATATAVLSGALLVGESVRQSLQDLVLRRLGQTAYRVAADRFFREDLAADLAQDPEFRSNFSASCPIIHLTGIVTHEKSGRRAYQVRVYGVDDRFWKFHGLDDRQGPSARDVYVGESLAAEVGARPEETLLLRIEKQEGIPKESLFGQREDTGRTIRLTCKEVLAPSALGDFSLENSQGSVRSIFVPLRRLQTDLGQTRRANAVLIASQFDGNRVPALRSLLKERFALEDLGLKLRVLEDKNVALLESDRVIIEDAMVEAARGAAAATGMRTYGILTYLANTIRCGNRSIPYSIISAADLDERLLSHRGPGGSGPTNRPEAAPSNSIWLNTWAGRDLAARIGDTIEIEYFLWKEEGRLETARAEFELAGLVNLEGKNADPHFAPEFPGVTDAEKIGDWNPPFPIDLKRIRPNDEEYWDLYRTTPKAFIPLARGLDLWKSRFGSCTSVRVQPVASPDGIARLEAFKTELRSRLDPSTTSFVISGVRARGLEASRGSTDFGEYFLYFSFFLIAAAVLLAALFFRLGIEQRVREIGLLAALGFSRADSLRLFLLEGMVLASLGGVFGILASLGYAGVLILGLRTWWVGAIGSPFLNLHLSTMPLLAGAVAGVGMALVSTAQTLRGLRRATARAMLSGGLESLESRLQNTRNLKILFALASVASGSMLVLSSVDAVDKVLGFFTSGILLLTAMLSAVGMGLRKKRKPVLASAKRSAIFLLGARNVDYRPGRSVLCMALIAAATFILVSVEAFRRDPSGISWAKDSGTGGFPLMAESVLPLIHDINTFEAQETFGLSSDQMETIRQARFVAFRLRQGEDASCRNLYSPTEPRILGVPRAFLEQRRFAFRDTLARTASDKENPWLLLESSDPAGLVPAIADANTIQYVLHKKVGDEILVHSANGAPVRLRLVAGLRDSIFQSEILISEANFLRRFPEQQGYRFFLIDLPAEGVGRAAAALEEGLAEQGLDVTSTADRLAAYHQVENTYLSTFQSLGGLGLILGTLGLGTVLLRNVLERRRELALLRAVGYTRSALAAIVVSENIVLLVLGLLAGAVGAIVAIAPALVTRGGSVSFWSLGLLLSAVLLAGLTASILAVFAAFRAPLLSSLRSE